MSLVNLNSLEVFIDKELSAIKELSGLHREGSPSEQKMIHLQEKSLKSAITNSSKEIINSLNKVFLAKKLNQMPSEKVDDSLLKDKGFAISHLEKSTLKRLKKRERVKSNLQRNQKPSLYVKWANNVFADFARSMIEDKKFSTLERSLIKSNSKYTPLSYLSVILFSTLLAGMFACLFVVFLLFFNLQSTLPFVTAVSEDFLFRFGKVFWLAFALPIGTFAFLYFYPSLERTAIEHKINQELPFATIHMAAISGSMIDPTKMFSIIISTNEYPCLEKEFTKLLNEINIYGYNLAGALRNMAFNSPSNRLAELLNGMATTITSGGDLTDYFEKRSESLLFEHRIEMEKETKSAETFMDIYVSVVIAAPMILMLLLMMIKISGIGLALSMSAISIIFVMGVSLINVVFLTFLHLKQSTN